MKDWNRKVNKEKEFLISQPISNILFSTFVLNSKIDLIFFDMIKLFAILPMNPKGTA